MPRPDRNGVAGALLAERDQTEQAAERIDHDPEEALDALERAGLKKAPNVGEVTPAQMFDLMRQMQSDMMRMQQQIVDLMSGQRQVQQQNTPNLAAELEKDRIQREATLEAWRTEPRVPVWLQPDDDEQKLAAAHNGEYPPRIFRINGLEYMIKVGEITEVPVSIAVVVHGTQRKRPMQGSPQGLQAIADPQRGQFLAGSQSISVGQAGKAGEGRLIPAAVAASPRDAQPLDVRYDHNGQ